MLLGFCKHCLEISGVSNYKLQFTLHVVATVLFICGLVACTNCSKTLNNIEGFTAVIKSLSIIIILNDLTVFNNHLLYSRESGLKVEFTL